jgi:hypothetical protein
MHDFIAAACEIAGLRRIPSDRQISTWLRTQTRSRLRTRWHMTP